MIFTPKNKDGKRLRFNVKTSVVPRGRVAINTAFKMVTADRKWGLICKVVPCSSQGCVCDAELLRKVKLK